MPTVTLVVGARPNFVKAAPLHAALEASGDVRVRLLHTGQHYDAALSDTFIDQLGLPRPDHFLGVGSGTHAEQTAAVLVGVERVLGEDPCDALVVTGDVNSTLAAALAAAKVGIPVVHLESGLRSGDWSMPEEVNRVLTDKLSDLLLCHSPEALDHLAREGVRGESVLVGNTMIDSLFRLLPLARAGRPLERLGLTPGGYVLVTLHRPALVDDGEALAAALGALADVAARMPVVFPVHPRTRARLAAVDAPGLDRIRLLEPQSYLDFIVLEADAQLVVTDSGGVQEETTALGVPCLTYRTTTERPVTCTHGTNRLVGVDPDALREACARALDGPAGPPPPPIPLWDGRAGERAAAAVTELLERALAARA